MSYALKHISAKNANYGAAEQYLTFEHDDFALSCIRTNMKYGKNNQREDIKSRHYIISFAPRDAPDNGLTADRAQELGLSCCKEHFPGHQAIVCTHPDSIVQVKESRGRYSYLTPERTKLITARNLKKV